jgi:hypothetical protein
MRINVYSQELTPEVQIDAKRSNTGRVYRAVRLMLHSSPMLHHPPEDDDRSAITFWLPSSRHRCELMAEAFEEIARRFREGPATLGREDSESGKDMSDDVVCSHGDRFRLTSGGCALCTAKIVQNRRRSIQMNELLRCRGCDRKFRRPRFI